MSAASAKYVASASEADHEANLTQYATRKCGFVLAVGGLMGTATQKVAAANTGIQFGIVDSKVEATNVFPMQFDTARGADVIRPVAGGTGLGTASAAQASGGKVSVIWVDADGGESAAQYCSVFLSTVVKGITGAVEKAVVAGAKPHVKG